MSLTTLVAALALGHGVARQVARDTCATDRQLDVPRRAASRLVIPPPGEPGTPVRLTGRVLDARGQPKAGVVLYAYHANAAGKYPKRPGLCGAARIQGYLRGYVQTDASGRYEIVTIRPGIYEERDTPAHIHMTVSLRQPAQVEHFTWIDDVMFDDDPILDARWRGRLEGRGGSGIVRATRTVGDTLVVTRDILWHRIPGAPGRR